MRNRAAADASLTFDLQAALRAASRSQDITQIRELGGGCIHRVLELKLTDGSSVIAKINSRECHQLFEEELRCLEALCATQTVLTPSPITCAKGDSFSILIMTKIEPPRVGESPQIWEEFGRDLAALHAADAGERYGFGSDNHIGSTQQRNTWSHDWVEFNRSERLGFQLALASASGALQPNEAHAIEAVINRVEQIVPRRPRPALLHGDLWSGNALPTQREDGRFTCAVIDPACSIGDGWADIAMMKLFGGFDERCFASYAELHPKPPDYSERILLYQLYHVLNHVNIFGRGYVAQAMSIAQRLGVG